MDPSHSQSEISPLNLDQNDNHIPVDGGRSKYRNSMNLLSPASSNIPTIPRAKTPEHVKPKISKIKKLKKYVANKFNTGTQNIKNRWNNSSKLDKAIVVTAPISAISAPLIFIKTASVLNELETIREYKNAKKNGEFNTNKNLLTKMIYPQFAKEFNVETILFTRVVNNFKKNVNMDNPDDKQYAFNMIYDNFIDQDGVFSININYFDRQELTDLKSTGNGNNINKDTFNSAVDEQQALMKDTLMRRLPDISYNTKGRKVVQQYEPSIFKAGHIDEHMFEDFNYWSNPDTLKRPKRRFVLGV